MSFLKYPSLSQMELLPISRLDKMSPLCILQKPQTGGTKCQPSSGNPEIALFPIHDINQL